jgi:hypothetical protein
VRKSALDYLHLAAGGGNWKRECLYADGSSPDFPNRVRQQGQLKPFVPGMIKPELTLENTREFMAKMLNLV